MKELSIKRALSDGTKKEDIILQGKTYSLHITANGEVIIADASDYEKIYSVQSVDFFNAISL